MSSPNHYLFDRFLDVTSIQTTDRTLFLLFISQTGLFIVSLSISLNLFVGLSPLSPYSDTLPLPCLRWPNTTVLHPSTSVNGTYYFLFRIINLLTTSDTVWKLYYGHNTSQRGSLVDLLSFSRQVHGVTTPKVLKSLKTVLQNGTGEHRPIKSKDWPVTGYQRSCGKVQGYSTGVLSNKGYPSRVGTVQFLELFPDLYYHSPDFLFREETSGDRSPMTPHPSGVGTSP